MIGIRQDFLACRIYLMKLETEEITELQQIFREERGIELSRIEAEEEGTNLINLIRILFK
jgi:hypothetical protein